MPNKQSWFGENRLLSLYMGLNHPQKLFLMQDCCSKTILENSKASDGTLDGEPFGLGWCLSSSKKKKNIDIIQLSYERERNDSSKIAKWRVHFFSFHFLKNKCVWQMMLWFHLFELLLETKDVSTNKKNWFIQITSWSVERIL